MSFLLTLLVELCVKSVSLQLVAWAAYEISICYIEAVIEVARTFVAIADLVYSSGGRLQPLQ